MTKDSKVSKAYNDIWATCPDVYKLIVDKDKDRKHFVEGSQINRVFRAVLTFDHLRNELLPSSKILDIGCGLGFNTCYLSTLGFDVNGFDASEVGIERSKKLAIFLGLDPEIFVCANHNYLESIESDSVDAVIGMGFIYYLDDKSRDKTYREVFRILKKNGIFDLTLTNVLFDAFSLNNKSLDFWGATINEFSSAKNIIDQNINELLAEHIIVPRRRVLKKSISNKFEIHADNPLLYHEVASKYGFMLEKILYPDSHILPPFLEEKLDNNEIDRIKAECCVQKSSSWYGTFMDYEFLAFLRKNQ